MKELPNCFPPWCIILYFHKQCLKVQIFSLLHHTCSSLSFIRAILLVHLACLLAICISLSSEFPVQIFYPFFALVPFICSVWFWSFSYFNVTLFFILIFNCLAYYIEKQLVKFYIPSVYFATLPKLILSFSYSVAVGFIGYST